MVLCTWEHAGMTSLVEGAREAEGNLKLTYDWKMVVDTHALHCSVGAVEDMTSGVGLLCNIVRFLYLAVALISPYRNSTCRRATVHYSHIHIYLLL